MAKTPSEEFADSLTLAQLADQIDNKLAGARVHIENYRQFREDPDGNADGHQESRCEFWWDMTLTSLQDAEFFASAIRNRKEA